MSSEEISVEFRILQGREASHTFYIRDKDWRENTPPNFQALLDILVRKKDDMDEEERFKGGYHQPCHAEEAYHKYIAKDKGRCGRFPKQTDE